MSYQFIFSDNIQKGSLIGSWSSKVIEDYEFSENGYSRYETIIFFESGKFVIFQKSVNKNNSTDVKYKPGVNGVYEVYGDTIFLLTDDTKTHILKSITFESIKGVISETEYFKDKK